MRTVFDYKTKKEYEEEKARFMSLYYYFDDDEWFDREAIDKYIRMKNNPHYESKRKNLPYREISTTRIPTRCPICRRAWAMEIGKGNKFYPNYLDPSVYNNIPLVSGDCHECGEDNG